MDPLAEKYPAISPYVFGADNPIRFLDDDGREVIDANGQKVTYSTTSGFSYSGSDAGMKLFVTSLQLTETGTNTLRSLIETPTIVQVEIDEGRDDGKRGEKLLLGHTAGSDETVRDTKTGTDVYKDALLQIFTGSRQVINEAKGNEQYTGSSQARFVNGVGVHEAIHVLNDTENNKKLQAECKCTGKELTQYIKANAETSEAKPNEVERTTNQEYDQQYGKP